MSKYNEMFVSYNFEISELYAQRTDNQERTGLIVEISDLALEKMRSVFNNEGFQSISDEVEFFKAIKPKIVAQRIANSMLLDLQLKQRLNSEEEFEKCKQDKLMQLKVYFSEYVEFYKYFNSQNTYRDEHYFTLNATKTDLITKILPNIDIAFSTGYDMILAHILACDILSDKAEILHENEWKPVPQLQWTSAKYDLVELVLALHHQKVFNNGKSDLKEIALAMGQIFNMNLNDINRASFSIKNRKRESSKFLHELASNLNRIISESNR